MPEQGHLSPEATQNKVLYIRTMGCIDSREFCIKVIQFIIRTSHVYFAFNNCGTCMAEA